MASELDGSVDLISPNTEIPGQLAQSSLDGRVEIETGIRIEPGTNVFVLGPAEFCASGEVVHCKDQHSTFVVSVDVSEKRRAARIQTRAHARIRVFSGAPARETMIEIVEASTQGLGFEARQAFKPGSMVQISLDYAMVFAEVRHCRLLPSGIYRAGVEIARVMCFAAKALPKHQNAGLAVEAALEKRSEPRIDCASAAELTVFGDKITTTAAIISNISRSGLQISAVAPLTPGDQILVRLEKLVVFAEVRHCRPGEKGFLSGVRIWDVIGERGLCDHLRDDEVELLANGRSFSAAEKLFARRLGAGCPCCNQYAQATEALLRRVRVIQGSH